MAKSKLIQWLEAAESAVPDLKPWESKEIDYEPFVLSCSPKLGLFVMISVPNAAHAWTTVDLYDWSKVEWHNSPAELSLWLEKAWVEALNRLRSASPVDATERIASLRQALTTIVAASGDLNNALNAMTFIGETAASALDIDDMRVAQAKSFPVLG